MKTNTKKYLIKLIIAVPIISVIATLILQNALPLISALPIFFCLLAYNYHIDKKEMLKHIKELIENETDSEEKFKLEMWYLQARYY